MQTKKIGIILLSVFSYLHVNAQTDSTKTRSVVVFGNTSIEEPEYNGIALKLGLLDMLGGMYGLHAEKEFGELMALQFGAGLTGRNYMMAFMFNDLEGSLDDGNMQYNHTNRTSTPGYFVALQPKLYYNEYGFDGSYMLLNLSQRRYNFSASDVMPNTGISSEVTFNASNKLKEFENQTVLSVGWGHQKIGDKSALDYGLSIGVRNIKAERRFVSPTTNPNSGDQTGFVARLGEVKKQQFYIEWFFRAGLNFKPKK